MISPDKYNNSSLDCDKLRNKFIKILAVKYDVPNSGGLLSNRERLVFDFRHPYFDLPGNQKLPEHFSKQSSVNSMIDEFNTKDLMGGSSVYRDEKSKTAVLLFELGITASLYREIIYLYDDYMHKVKTRGPFLCVT